VREALSLTLSPNVDGREVYDRFFDFSKIPNLQEVNIGVGWVRGGLPWIPMTLSTLKPATSPHLSAIRLEYSIRHTRDPDISTIEDDLRRAADEVARIRREFGGAVDAAMVRDPWYL